MSKGTRTRSRVVETAAGLMNRRGWLSTPLSEVLEATNLRKGGFYNHFDSLYTLTGEAFDFAAGHLVGTVRERLSGDGSARERLRRLLDAFDLVGRRRPPFDGGCPLLNAAIAADTDEALRARVANVLRTIIALVAGVIGDGVRAGEFRRDLEPARAAQFLLAAFEGGVMLAGATREPGRFDAIRADLQNLIDGWTVRPEETS